jgi:hypothetical protein
MSNGSVQYIHIVSAVNIVNGNPVPKHIEESKYIQQLVGSLEVYKRRGAFDGTMPSACECLQLAGYETETTYSKETK